MKARRQANGENWDVDVKTITVRIPMTWKRHGGRKVIIAPYGGDRGPRPDNTLIRALARAHRWKRLLEEGRYRSAGELAEAEGVTRSFVNRLLRLTLLAPDDIVEPILDGRHAKGLQMVELTVGSRAPGPRRGTISSRDRRRNSRQRAPPELMFRQAT